MQTEKKKIQGSVSGLADEFLSLSRQIIEDSNINLPWVDYLNKISKTLIEFSRCDAIELQLEKYKKDSYELIRRTKSSFHFEIISCQPCPDDENKKPLPVEPDLERFHSSFFTENGSFRTGDMAGTLKVYPEEKIDAWFGNCKINKNHKSIAVIPIKVGNRRIGLLQLLSRAENIFTKEEIVLYENFVMPLGLVLSNQRSQAALRERVKELTCLYGIAQAVEKHGTSLDAILDSTVNLIPPAWQYPEITQGRITLNGQSYTTPAFKDGPYKQTADIVLKGKKRGSIEVVYTEEKQDIDEGPFLEEERHLINTMARELALIIERKHSELEEIRLQEQLLHADRLATIGQLASGVAHELNEPLTNILGFAQLAKKDPQLPEQPQQDMEKIINASLHAREIVKKLQIFARQMPTRKVKTNLNHVVKEGIYFLESRCKKEGIEVVCSYEPDLPEIIVDQAQLTQVLVNLAVNAIQAMPAGGKLKISTISAKENVSLVIEDTGVGMEKEVLEQIFLPFFTTKDVGEGTGLGLSVVHGIVTSHGGSIFVNSKVGVGTKFEIRLPQIETIESLAAEVEEDGKI